MTADGSEVVLVEPDAGVARALATALERCGHRPRLARNAREALSLPDPDVLVAAAGEAEEGLALFEEARRRGRLAGSVLLAGELTSEELALAAGLGPLELLRRPVQLADLARAVEAAGALRQGDIRFTVRAGPTAVQQAALHLLAYALGRGVGPTARARMASAAAEAVDNAARHAFPHGTGTIELTARASERQASVRVRDRGTGFSPNETLRRRRQPRGLHRARALAEGLELWSAPGEGTSVLLRFGLYRVALDAGSVIDLSELDYFPPDTSRELLEALHGDPEGTELALSPALAVLVGRLLSASAAPLLEPAPAAPHH